MWITCQFLCLTAVIVHRIDRRPYQWFSVSLRLSQMSSQLRGIGKWCIILCNHWLRWSVFCVRRYTDTESISSQLQNSVVVLWNGCHTLSIIKYKENNTALQQYSLYLIMLRVWHPFHKTTHLHLFSINLCGSACISVNTWFPVHLLENYSLINREDAVKYKRERALIKLMHYSLFWKSLQPKHPRPFICFLQ